MPREREDRSPAEPRVSVALATWNGAKFLREQVLSLLWQRGCRTIVYIRDDGSTDGTQLVAGELANEFPARVLLVQDGMGQSGSAAQNFYLLLQHLVGRDHDYVALADQDDIWEGGKLARAIGQMECAEAEGYSSNLVAFATSTAPPSLVRKDYAAARWDHLFQTASAGCTYVLSASLAQLVAERLAKNRPNPDIAHDILIYAIARANGVRWHYDPAAHILYRQHGGNLVGSRAGIPGIAARWRLIRSGWYRRQTAGLAPYLPDDAPEQQVIARVARAGFGDRIWLALNARSCRRRGREALAFAVQQFVS